MVIDIEPNEPIDQEEEKEDCLSQSESVIFIEEKEVSGAIVPEK